MKNKQKGITLIALVITIIVLLILAGVTINLTLGENGIFKTAEQAAKNYTNAQDKEMADIGNFDNTVAGIIEEVTGEYRELSTKAQPGDYVKYVPSAKLFSMTPEQTGQDANQDYNTGSYKDEEGNPGLWQVLYNDDEHGLQIISADVVEELTLGNDDDDEKSKQIYNNAVDTLNTFCINYVDIRYATNGRSVGSNPINPEDTLDLTNPEDTEKLKFKYKDTYESGCKVTDKNYLEDYNAMKAATNQNANGIYNIGRHYFLASRMTGLGTGGSSFFIRDVNIYGKMYGSALMWYVESTGKLDSDSNTRGIRPVVTLISNIQTNNGNGSKTTPFELVVQ